MKDKNCLFSFEEKQQQSDRPASNQSTNFDPGSRNEMNTEQRSSSAMGTEKRPKSTESKVSSTGWGATSPYYVSLARRQRGYAEGMQPAFTPNKLPYEQHEQQPVIRVVKKKPFRYSNIIDGC